MFLGRPGWLWSRLSKQIAAISALFLLHVERLITVKPDESGSHELGLDFFRAQQQCSKRLIPADFIRECLTLMRRQKQRSTDCFVLRSAAITEVLAPVAQNLQRWSHFRAFDLQKHSSLTRFGPQNPPLTAPGGSGVPSEERVPDRVLTRVSCPPHVPKCVCRAPTLQQLGSCLRAPVFFPLWPPKLLTSDVSFSV